MFFREWRESIGSDKCLSIYKRFFPLKFLKICVTIWNKNCNIVRVFNEGTGNIYDNYNIKVGGGRVHRPIKLQSLTFYVKWYDINFLLSSYSKQKNNNVKKNS